MQAWKPILIALVALVAASPMSGASHPTCADVLPQDETVALPGGLYLVLTTSDYVGTSDLGLWQESNDADHLQIHDCMSGEIPLFFADDYLGGPGLA